MQGVQLSSNKKSECNLSVEQWNSSTAQDFASAQNFLLLFVTE